MKKFIITVLSVSVFFIGLGGLFEKASANFKSDEKALEIIAKARRAIGGDQAISSVKSMTILGKATKTFEVEGIAKTDQGDFEINYETPGKLSKQIKIGSGEGNGIADKKVDVILMRKGDGDNVQFKTTDDGDGNKKFTIVRKDGATEDINADGKEKIVIRRNNSDVVTSADNLPENINGKKIFIRRADGLANAEFVRSNELFRTTFSLLLSAPEGLDVSYTYVGEGSVDGASCDIIAANDGGSTIKLYIDRSTSLPRMMTFQAHKPMIIRLEKTDAKPDPNGDVKVFTRKMEAPEMAEFQVKFSDFRSVNGLQLPFKWTQTVGGKDDEVLDVTSYEVNPANISEKFKETPTKVFVRTKKEQ